MSVGFRVVFFGTPAFAVPTLEALLRSEHQVVAVVTQPDRPAGRGHRIGESPVKSCARSAAVPVLQPAHLKDESLVSSLTDLKADVGVVAAYGRILPRAILNVPPLGLLNVHASLLPRYRGAAPVHRAVIAGERETGVTIMRVVAALDAGPMLAARRRPIGEHETSLEVERDLAAVGAGLLVATLDRLRLEPIDETPQDERAATHAPRLTKEDGAIDWTQPARRIHDLVRGLHPWPLAYTFLDGHRLIVRRTAVVPDAPGAVPGSVVAAHGGVLAVAAGRDVVRLIELQPEGRRRMGSREFLAGHALAPGARFSSGS